MSSRVAPQGGGELSVSVTVLTPNKHNGPIVRCPVNATEMVTTPEESEKGKGKSYAWSWTVDERERETERERDWDCDS